MHRRIEALQTLVDVRRKKGFASAAALDDGGGKVGARLVERTRQFRQNEADLFNRRTGDAETLRGEAVRTGVLSLGVLAFWLLTALLAASEFGRAQRRLNHFLQSVSDGFLAIDRRWRITHINRAAEEFYAVSARDVLGREMLEVFPKMKDSELERLYRTTLQSGRAEIYTGPSPTTGKIIEGRCFPTREGIVIFFRDVTDQVLQRRRIEQMNETLERRVLERTAQLEGFCYSIAHDMRTHIRGVSINASILRSELIVPNPEVEQHLDRLVTASRQIARLVDDLLEHARSATFEVIEEPTDLSQAATDVAAILKESGLYPPDIEYAITPGLEAVADPQLIRVAIQNLFDNACKYRSPDRPPRIEFGRTILDGVETFYVADNGRGFDTRFSARMFMPFERLHNDSRIPGSGIGLANVKRIIERHRGRVWATSTPNEGSTFYFTLGEGDSTFESTPP